LDDVKNQGEATGQSFSLGIGKRHDGKNRQSENDQGVQKSALCGNETVKK
jgi:hypothetical protein